MKTTFILIGALLITSISSLAWPLDEQQGEQEKDYTQSSHNAGWRQAKDESDKTLNQTYHSLMKQIESKESKSKLIKAQRAWIAYRDAACDFETIAWKGSSPFDTFYSQCFIRITEARILELKASIEEGGF